MKDLAVASLLATIAFFLPILTRGRRNTTWSVYLLRKPIPMLLCGIAVGLLVCALISQIKNAISN